MNRTMKHGLRQPVFCQTPCCAFVFSISPSENKKGDDKICELKNAVTQTLFKNPSHDFAIPVQDLD